MRQGPDRSQGSALEILLYLLSLAYGGAVGLRLFFFKQGLLKPKRLPCKVVSVGNLTVGGTGKTPMTIYVVQVLRRLGYRTAVLTRGYKGVRERIGAIVSDGERVLLGPDEAGDEPYLMACRLEGTPVLVGKDRFASGRVAIKAFGSNVLVLDDGFQHLQLERNVNLLLLDAARPFGNGHLLPRGILRESPRQLSRGDALILTRSDRAAKSISDCVLKDALGRGAPVFRCNHIPSILGAGENPLRPKSPLQPSTLHIDKLKGRRALVVSGIARNDDFQKTVSDLGCNILETIVFPDHHLYLRGDLERIVKIAVQLRADCVVTTEKDYVRMVKHDIIWPAELLSLRIELSFGDDRQTFESFLEKKISDGAQNVSQKERCDRDNGKLA